MADLDALVGLIYHERQQQGSMLCAQHALNSLLQGNYFTAPDLAAIAHSFDTLEQHALGVEERASTNMDDSGFFSVQVVDSALEVWGLSLVRWRSEQMRSYNASPHTQLAFVLNLNQHWFTLRRFGPAMPDASRDPGNGHWFNLNSSYDRPKWVSRTYLGMFIEQSEEEGYSVFAVVQTDPSAPLALPRTEADNMAVLYDAPDGAPGHSSATGSAMPGAFPDTSGVAHDGEGEVVIPPETDFDMASEDMELQAALAASLGGGAQDYSAYTQSIPALSRAPPTSAAHDRSVPISVDNDDDDENDGDYVPSGSESSDPVAASMARNQALLARMLREQEAAFREGREDDGGAAAAAASERQRLREEEEEAQIRAAIEASMAEHSGSPGGSGSEGVGGTGNETPSARQAPGLPFETGAGLAGPVTNQNQNRIYDDEDAELQAALRASLAELPPDFVHPPSPPPLPISTRPQATSMTSSAVTDPPPPVTASGSESEIEDSSSVVSTEPATPVPAPQLDVDEIRRRRLARFGGGAGASGPPPPLQE